MEKMYSDWVGGFEEEDSCVEIFVLRTALVVWTGWFSLTVVSRRTGIVDRGE
jgi:hypothetical protein